MQIDFAARELTIKLVYYGPALSGKTTNLQSLHAAASSESAGRLMTLETKDDRTLFFDLLPLRFEGQGSVAVRVKVFTVPGQVIHAATRRLVLQGADGVAFIADSQESETDHNAESFVDLKKNLKTNGIELSRMPLVIQFNKRDLPDVRTDDELKELAAQGNEPVYMASAMKGDGVVETFMGLLNATWQRLDRFHNVEQKFRLDGDALLSEVAAQLGKTESARHLIGQALGSKLREDRS